MAENSAESFYNMQLPTDAQKHYDARGDELLRLLRPLSVNRQTTHREAESSERHTVVHRFAGRVVLTGRVSVDHAGHELSRCFESTKGPIGLEGADYLRFQELVRELGTRREIRDFLSRSFLKKTVFAWLSARHKETAPPATPLIAYLKERAASDVRIRKASIPVAHLGIEKPFSIGDVTFEYYTEALFDRMADLVVSHPTATDKTRESFDRRIRKRYQGTVFASTPVFAEPEKCVEIAMARTELALVVLRFHSPYAVSAETPCFFGPMGKSELPVTRAFLFDQNLPVPTIIEGLAERMQFRWFVSSLDIEKAKGTGLHLASEMISKAHPSEVEELLMICMTLFSRAMTAREFCDRMVFVLASAETLLLRDTSEPIQHTLGMRLAFMLDVSAEERKSIVDVVKKAYKLRSNYLHHGESETDYAVLQKLQVNVWIAIYNVLMNPGRFTTKKDLHDYIETRILT